MKKFSGSLFLFLFFYSSLFSQINNLKNNAVKEMQAGRFGEAIDILNRYISANPQESDGYSLRGLCFEKRNQYEMAVSDFRTAKKLNPSDKTINQNLSRVRDAWNKVLYSRIEGYRREIAISKNYQNFIEISKSYASLDDWGAAEEWFDKFLTLKEPSPDEVLKYCEILSKSNHLSKGEAILKKYSERFPEDHRIWSTYGYFLLWSGKSKFALSAFKKAIQLRPYFKEALDGLELAKNKGILFSGNPSSKKRPPEYSIDSYYIQLTKDSSLVETRYLLIDELLKKNRIEEAFDQLIFLQNGSESDSPRFKEKWSRVESIKDSAYRFNVQKYSEIFNKNNNDKDAAQKLSSAYANLYDYDNAINILEQYLSNTSEEKELDLRFTLTKYCAWSYQWDKAYKNGNILIKYQPDNIDYKLLMAQIISWNVIDETPEELQKAKKYLNEILTREPDRLPAVMAMAFLAAGMKDFDEADKYILRAQQLKARDSDIEALLNYYNTRKEIATARQVLNIREECGKLAEEEKCDEAAEKYKQIFLLTPSPSKELYVEYASFLNCAGHFTDAVDSYSKILEKENDIELIFLRAATRVSAGDTLQAIYDLQDLYLKDSSNYNIVFNLGSLYEKTNRISDAVVLYKKIIEESNRVEFLDSVQTATLKIKLGYLENNKTAKGKLNLGTGLSPISLFYADNKNMVFYNYGLKTDLRITPQVSFAVQYLKHFISNEAASNSRILDSYTGFVQYSNSRIYISAGLGKTKTSGNYTTDNFVFNIIYDKKNEFGVSVNYEKNDSRVLLYSPFIVDNILNIKTMRINGYYYFKNNFYLNAYAGHLSISDGNNGNAFQFRAARIINLFKLGYEFYYSGYTTLSNMYYSPSDLESHSLWGEYQIIKKASMNLETGIKVGYVPANDYILSELFLKTNYLPLPVLSLNITITFGSTRQYNSTYNYLSAYASAYLSIF